MKACYPASFQGMGEAKPYSEQFGHPTHRMTRVAINGPLPKDIGTGFAEVQEWEFEATCHPVIPAWFRRHFSEGGWAPTQLLAFLTESGLLRSLKVREAIISFENRTEVWLHESRIQACSVIGKFTQGSKADGKRLTKRLVTGRGELDYLVRTPASRALWSERQSSASLVTSSPTTMAQPQFAHLRASILAYAHINLLSMLSRFEPDEAVRVATDSIYVKTTALCKLEVVGAYKPQEVHPEGYCRICLTCHDKATPRPPRDGIAPARWRDKDESLYMPMEHAAYLAKPDYKATKKGPYSQHRAAPLRSTDPTSAELPKRRRGKRQNHASDRALPYKKPLVFTRPIAWPKRCGPGASNPKLTTVYSDTLALNLLEQPKKILSFSRASMNTSGSP